MAAPHYRELNRPTDKSEASYIVFDGDVDAVWVSVTPCGIYKTLNPKPTCPGPPALQGGHHEKSVVDSSKAAHAARTTQCRLRT